MILTLASASPRRRELVRKLGMDVEIHPADADEHTEEKDDKTAVTDIAERKARAVSGDLVLGADTMVVACGRRLGKPKNEREAYEMFSLLCGRTHSVLTGVCLIGGGKCVRACEETLVEFGPYDDAVVSAYIRSGKPFDKAGGYGIQDPELAPIIKNITGDYDNVLGLPVKLVGRLIGENFT